MGEYSAFVEKIHRKLDIDLAMYKEAQMKRRLTSLRNKHGYGDFRTYYDALAAKEVLMEEFVDRLTINVSEFYRNPKRWEVLTEKIIPEVAGDKRKLTVWSAACSTGEEPYTLAMIFNEHFSHLQVDILATDLDEKVLEKANLGHYKAQSLKDLPAAMKSKYFTYQDNTYMVNEQLKRSITFKQHNLLNDPYPANVDLIVCRNVLIYFTDTAKDNIYHNFSRSLIDKGILFVGSTEQIFNPEDYQLSLFDTFFYQKT